MVVKEKLDSSHISQAPPVLSYMRMRGRNARSLSVGGISPHLRYLNLTAFPAGSPKQN